jgi:S-adenosyl-L-methionine hydrolase (adenosine-forming)
MLGGPQRVVALENPEYQLPAPGPTFAGRDIMAPAAARLAAGTPIDGFGPDVDPATLAPGLVPLPNEQDDGSLQCEVLWIDRFGNAQLNVAPEHLAGRGVEPGGMIGVRIGERERRARWVHTFSDAKPAELVVLTDSYGMCTLALDQRSASAELKLRAGNAVTIVTPEV